MKINHTFTLSFLTVWTSAFVLSMAGYSAVFLQSDSMNVIRPVLIITAAAMIICWTYLSFRLFRFFSRLRAFFYRLLSNDYSTGIRDIACINDEISAITGIANRAADQLRVYDTLRAERTRMNYRAMNLLFNKNKQGIILAYIDKKQFRFNPYAQNIYDIKQETFSFEAIEKQKGNTRFFRIFLVAALREGIAKEDTAELQLPQRETSRLIRFMIEPLKDHNGKVRFALIFITPLYKEQQQELKT